MKKCSLLVHYLFRGLFNPLMSSVTFLYPLKTSENLRFSDVFKGYKNVTLDINGLIRSHFVKCDVTVTLTAIIICLRRNFVVADWLTGRKNYFFQKQGIVKRINCNVLLKVLLLLSNAISSFEWVSQCCCCYQMR